MNAGDGMGRLETHRNGREDAAETETRTDSRKQSICYSLQTAVQLASTALRMLGPD
jgi:hypothetical protein